MKKLNLAVLCGGQSGEHEVSIVSAKNVINALDKNKYNIHIILITKEGQWLLCANPEIFIKAIDSDDLQSTNELAPVSLLLGNQQSLIYLKEPTKHLQIDIAFPVLHGSHGEDGTMQGLLEVANIPYVGPGVLGSAIAMDKEVSKRLLREAGIPISNYIVMTQHELQQTNLEKIAQQIGLPLFVKPANTGSSLGISKVKKLEELTAAVDLALRFDHKIIFEQFIAGREIECAVLGNENPQASLPGEIVPHHEFYTYEAKYIDPNGAALHVPAQLPAATIAEIQALAKKTFSTLCCEGMARVDFFLSADNKLYLNEANTIPGFTQISMYPKMWEASGLSYSDLLDNLIQLALQRFQRDRRLVTARITTM